MVVKTGMCVEVETDISQRTLTYDWGLLNLVHVQLRLCPPPPLPLP